MLYIGSKKVPRPAPGLIFDEKAHTYFLNGKLLSGVTKTIGKRCGKNYSGAGSLMDESIAEGNNIHKWLEKWVKTGKWETVHPNACWGRDKLVAKYGECDSSNYAFAEVLVTDFEIFASAVDILIHTQDGWDIIDTKTGKVDIEYLSWQCGCYKYFLEQCGYKINKCYCLATKDKYMYLIMPKSSEEIKGLLYGEKK